MEDIEDSEETEELNLTMSIDVKNKNVWLGEESGTGAEYDYKNIKDLVKKIKFYLVNYYKDQIEK